MPTPLLITGSDTAPVPRPPHALQAGHKGGRVPGGALLGDAAQSAGPAPYDGAEPARHVPRTPATSRPPPPRTGGPCSRGGAGAAAEDSHLQELLCGDDARRCPAGMFAVV